MTPAVQVSGGTLAFGSGDERATILDDLWLRVEPGEILAILGASGSGKSSLLSVLCGLTQLDAGTVTVLGGAPRDMLRQGRVAIASADAALLPWRGARDNARLPLDLLGRNCARSENVLDTLLDDLRIADLGRRRPCDLSEGQIQRVRLAQALATEPELLLLDEPFSNADEGLRFVLADQIRRYVLATPERSAVLVTHSSFEAASIADRVIIVTGLPLREIYHESFAFGVPKRKDDHVLSIVSELQPHLVKAAADYGAPAQVE